MIIWLQFKNKTKQMKNSINGIKNKHKMCIKSSINSGIMCRRMSKKLPIFLLILLTIINQGYCHALKNDGKSKIFSSYLIFFILNIYFIK
jgi:hypothetical protein